MHSLVENLGPRIIRKEGRVNQGRGVTSAVVKSHLATGLSFGSGMFSSCLDHLVSGEQKLLIWCFWTTGGQGKQVL